MGSYHKRGRPRKDMLHRCGCLLPQRRQTSFTEFAERSVKDDEEFYSNDENLKDALIYEFGNHECGYTWEFENGIIALGFSIKEFLSDERKAKVFAEARKEYIDKLEG